MADTSKLLKQVQTKDQPKKRINPELAQQASEAIHQKPDPGAYNNPAALQRALGTVGPHMPPSEARAVQRAYGNQFVQRWSKGQSMNGKQNGGNGHSVVRRSGGDSGNSVHSEVEKSIEQERGTGQSLPKETRETMEGSMGADFSGVRVHDDQKSDELNTALNARAFTTGNDVFFARDEYNPGSKAGDELIAHELTHTVQQGASPQNPQPKMDVNEPDDPYEQEADAVAQQVVEGPEAQEEAADKEVDTMTKQAVATSGVSQKEFDHVAPSLVQAMPVQREEDEEKSEEEKQKEEAEAKKEEAGSAKEEKQDEAAGEKEKAKSAGPAKEPPEAPEVPEPEEPGGEVENLAAPEIEEAPEPEIPDVPESEEPISDEDAQMEMDDSLEVAGEEEASEYSWSAVGPPDWNSEVHNADAFAALFSEEAQSGGEPGSLKLQFQDEGPSTQYVATQSQNSGGGDTSIAETEPQPLWTINKPEHKNFFVNTFIGDTWNKGLDIANQVGGFSTETNIYGVLARTLETVVMVTELITNVLTYIATALLIAAAILGIIGGILIGVGIALVLVGMALMGVPFAQGAASALISAGNTLISAGQTLLSWASTLLGWAGKLGTFIEKLTIIRLKLRAAIVVLRILDLLHALAQPGGDKAKILRQKMGQILDQATGAAGDGIALGLGKLAGKVPGGEWGQLAPGVAANMGGQIGGGVMGTVGGYFKDSNGEFFGSKSPVMDNPGGYWVDSGKSVVDTGWKDDDAGKQKDLAYTFTKPKDSHVQRVDDPGDEGSVETKIIDVEGEPQDAPFVTQASAINIAILQAEKKMLEARLGWVEGNLAEKEEWDANMAAGKAQSDADKAKMDEAKAAGEAQVAAAEQFQEVAGQGTEVGKEGTKDSDALGGEMNSFKGNMQTGVDKAAEQGAAGGDPSQTEGGAEQSSSGLSDTSNTSQQGASEAASVQSEAEENIAGVEESKSAYEEFDAEMEETQSENQEEMDMMLDDRESILERLAEIDAELEEQKSNHSSALEESDAWVSEAASQREGEQQEALMDKGGEEGSQAFYDEVQSNEPEPEAEGEAV